MLVACAAFSDASEQQLEVISLQHRLAAELIPALAPFVDSQGVIRANGSQLIIRTSDKNIQDIKKLIDQLDKPLRRLLIEVRQPLSGSRESDQASLSGQASVPANKAQVILRQHSTSSRDSAVTDQQIQVLEGHTALIKTGQQVPMAKKQIRNNGQVETLIEQQDVSSGFQVTPRLSGKTVILEIIPFSASLASSGGGVINQQQALTTLSGALGEWIEIAGVASQRQQSGQAKIYSTKRRNEQQRQILIRVTELQ